MPLILNQNDMKKTAVEWLVNELPKGDYNDKEKAIKKAKKMEKQNLYNFYMQGGVDAIFESERTADKYYKQTFKQ